MKVILYNEYRMAVESRFWSNNIYIYTVSFKVAIIIIKEISIENQVTLNTKYGKITLQIDTVATFNVIPKNIYIYIY